MLDSGIQQKCDPPRENRDKGDSTLTTRFHLKTIDFDFSTLKACSETCLISKSFVSQSTLNTIKRARPKKENLDVTSVRPYVHTYVGTHGLGLGTSLSLFLIWSPSPIIQNTVRTYMSVVLE